MGAFSAAAAAAPPVSLAELKAEARIATSDEDALLAGFVRAATDLCERFTGRLMIARAVTEIVSASTAWTRLGAAPVQSIEAVATLASGGVEVPLAGDAYGIDIDASGEGWVRLLAVREEKRLTVTYAAGLAADASDIPEALRQGIARLALHSYTQRDAREMEAPPAAVTALWRPWRRLRLG
jgi:uncharacterized phiE125 gp8 family phage protein